MLALFRPNTGHAPVLALFLGTAIFSGTACAPKPAIVDTWKLTPPTLELTNARGIMLKLKAGEFRSAQSGEGTPFIDESAALRFALGDHGLSVTFKSHCSSGEIKTEEHSETLITSDRVSILGLIPPLTLAPENLVKDWQCNLKMQVTNTTGSRSGGELRDLRVNFSALAARLASSNAQVARSDIKRRLICPTWWTDGSNDALDVLSRASVVGGVDTREIERQPRCSVLELGASPKINGLYRPVFAGARITVTDQKILIPVAELKDLYFRKLFSWTITNEERFAQTVFIAASQSSVRFAAILTPGGITTPIRVFPKFSQTGATEARGTPSGLYLRLASGSTVVVEMSSNRPTFASSFDFTQTRTTHLVVTTDIPISVSVLANESEAKNLSTRPREQLDRLARDPAASTSHVLLGRIVLEPNRSVGVLVPSKMTPTEAAAHPFAGGPECVEILSQGQINPFVD